MIKPGCCIVIVIVFPYSGFCRLIAESSCSIQIKQPERYINCPDLFEMIFIFKYFRKKRFSFVSALSACFASFLIHKRNDVIRTITVFKLFRHDHWMSQYGHTVDPVVFSANISAPQDGQFHTAIFDFSSDCHCSGSNPFHFSVLSSSTVSCCSASLSSSSSEYVLPQKFAFHLLFFTVKRKSSRTVWTFVV